MWTHCLGNKKEAKTDAAKSETRKPGDQETKLSPQEAPKNVGEWDDAGNDDDDDDDDVMMMMMMVVMMVVAVMVIMGWGMG